MAGDIRFERVTVTGGSGRLGRHVTRRLAGLCELTVVDRAAPEAGGRFIAADITHRDGLGTAFHDQDAVIHLAAIPNPRTAGPAETFRVNVTGTWNVLEAAEAAGVKRVVVCSSDAATGLHYNPPGWGPLYLPMDEDHPLRPSEAYGASKLVTEDIARTFAERGKMEITVIRPTHIVFPPEYQELEMRGADVHNYHLWAYVDPDDVAEAFALALMPAKAPFGPFFISAADTLSTRPTLDLIVERFGIMPEIRRAHVYDDHPTAAVWDITRARDDLGFVPKSDWRKMVATLRR